jgi:uncharacterized delta-60 repeat protein
MMISPRDGSIYLSLNGDVTTFAAHLNSRGTALPSPVRSKLNGIELKIVGLQPDGKILVEDDHRSASEVDLIRLNPDGTVDPTFGVAGAVRFRDDGAVPTATSGSFSIQKLLVRSDGSYVLNVRRDYLLHAATPGHTDTLYGLSPSGQVLHSYAFTPTTTNQSPSYFYQDMALAPDGKIVISFVKSTFLFNMYSVMRLNADLTPDVSAPDYAVPYFLPGKTFGGAIFVLPDARVLLTAVDPQSNASVLIRLSASGALDHTFAQNGVAPLVGITESLPAGRFAVQSDGKILIAVNDSRGAIWIHRYLPSGSPDPSFGRNGITAVYVGGRVQHPDDIIAIQKTPTGEKLLVTASISVPSDSPDDPIGYRIQGYVARLDL